MVNNRNKQLRLLSLFSGCGGMDLGFEGDFDVLKDSVNMARNSDWIDEKKSGDFWVHLKKNRFSTVFANDIRPDAQAAWQKYFSTKKDKSVYRLQSVVDFVKNEKEGKAHVFPENIDIVTGGFPCQDFSVAGKRLGFNSDKRHDGKKINDDDFPSVESRGQLYMWMREVISLTQPKMFVAENVKGLVSLSDAKETIERDFENISGNGYLVVDAKVLHAADYGVPQSRERVIFFGFKKSALTPEALTELSKKEISKKYDPYPPATHAYTGNSGKDLQTPVTVRTALSGLSEPENSDDPSQRQYSKGKFLGKSLQGQTEVRLDSIGPTIRSEHHGNIEYRRLSSEHGGTHIEELSANLPERRLTVRECARIQTFPDDYEFVFEKKEDVCGVSASNAYKIIGNAVPPLLGYNIAKRLEKNWELYFGKDKG